MFSILCFRAALVITATAATPSTQPAASQPAASQPASLEIRVTAATWAQTRSQVRAGDTVVFGDGEYGQLVIPAAWSGTIDRPTTLRAASRWKASFSSTSGHAIDGQSRVQFILLEGLQACRSKYSGIKVGGSDITLRNCWVHHNQLQGVEAHAVDRLRVERCLIEWNGSNPQHDHGIYADGNSQAVVECIVRHNSGNGLSMGTFVYNHLYQANLIHANGGCGIATYLAATGPLTRILNNTIAFNTSDQLSLRGYWRAWDPTGFVDRNMLIGVTPLGYATLLDGRKANVIEGDNHEAAEASAVAVLNDMAIRMDAAVRDAIAKGATASAMAPVIEQVNALKASAAKLSAAIDPGFVYAKRGDFRLRPESTAKGYGWPRERWPIDTSDWDAGKYPYEVNPANGAPRSLFPESRP